MKGLTFEGSYDNKETNLPRNTHNDDNDEGANLSRISRMTIKGLTLQGPLTMMKATTKGLTFRVFSTS